MTPATLAALHRACFRRPPPWNEAAFAALLAGTGCVFLTTGAEGFALGRAIAGEAELLTLAVHPGARRLGHGRHLLTAFEDEAARRGARVGVLEVAADNVAARALYLGQGYHVAGHRPGLYTAPGLGRMDALVMRHSLAAEPAEPALRTESG